MNKIAESEWKKAAETLFDKAHVMQRPAPTCSIEEAGQFVDRVQVVSAQLERLNRARVVLNISKQDPQYVKLEGRILFLKGVT